MKTITRTTAVFALATVLGFTSACDGDDAPPAPQSSERETHTDQALEEDYSVNSSKPAPLDISGNDVHVAGHHEDFFNDLQKQNLPQETDTLAQAFQKSYMRIALSDEGVARRMVSLMLEGDDAGAYLLHLQHDPLIENTPAYDAMIEAIFIDFSEKALVFAYGANAIASYDDEARKVQKEMGAIIEETGKILGYQMGSSIEKSAPGTADRVLEAIKKFNDLYNAHDDIVAIGQGLVNEMKEQHNAPEDWDHTP